MPDTPSILESPALRKQPRLSLLRIMALGVLLLTVGGVLLVRHLEDRARGEVMGEFLANRARESQRSLEDFTRPVANLLQLVPRWAQKELLSFDDPERIRDQFAPLLDPNQGVHALFIVGHGGRSYELRRDGTEWRGALTLPEQLDLRGEEWYALATGPGLRGRVVLTEEDAEDPHLLAALAWEYTEADSTKIGAACLEMSEPASRDLATRLTVTEGSVMMMLGDGGLVFWLSPGTEQRLRWATLGDLVQSSEATPQLLAQARGAWAQRSESYDTDFDFDFQGSRYWAHALDLDATEILDSMILLVPQADLDARLNTLTRPFLAALVGVVLLGTLSLGLLYRLHRRRIRELRDRGEHTRLPELALRKLIDRGESDRLEFKSTLRWNLKANKPGKEIELAWLKTLVAYLNTEGGTLLVGVADDGSVPGIEPDGFKNEDKYLLHFNNCVKEHIGLEFARFLSFDIRSIEGKRILVVDARRAEEPAFLVHDDEEDFYVRVGPASRKVSPRKALDYLRDRE